MEILNQFSIREILLNKKEKKTIKHRVTWIFTVDDIVNFKDNRII